MPAVPGRGRLHLDPATDTWDWDGEVFRIHGCEPAAIVPTTDLVLASKHLEARERIRDLRHSVGVIGDSFPVSTGCSARTTWSAGSELRSSLDAALHDLTR